MIKRIRLEEILEDTISGSTELLLKLNGLIKENLDNKSELQRIISKAKKYFKTFETIQSYIIRVEGSLDDTSNKALKVFINEFEQNQRFAHQLMYENALPYLEGMQSILTISNSKTISESLNLLGKKNRKLKIIIAESRPMLEGRILAKELIKNKLHVELITDNMLAQYISKTDGVIIGADIILANGNIINKTGSLPAAILSRYYNKPFYVLASKDKISKSKKYVQEDSEPDEVWNHKSSYLKVRNFYFEEVNKELITKIITN